MVVVFKLLVGQVFCGNTIVVHHKESTSQNWNEGGGNWINVWKLESVIKKKCYYNPSLVGIGAVSVFDLEGLYIFKWNRLVWGAGDERDVHIEKHYN